MARGDSLEHTSSFEDNLLVLQLDGDDSETYTITESVERQIDKVGELTSSYGLSSNKDTSALFLREGGR